MVTTVRADAVRVGDKIYNHLALHQAFAWCVVNEIENKDGVIRLYYGSTRFPSCAHYHPAEGVAIERGTT
jgi:methyl coenzyme M reductase subunit D